jgi:hypothetical protein
VIEILPRVGLNLLLGFLLALPFAFIRRYPVRLLLCVAAPLVVYRISIYYTAHAGFTWNYGWALVLILGALFAAHVPDFWLLLKGRSQE